MSYSEHKLHKISARCAIITTTDTRTLSEDESGAFLENALSAAGHKISAHLIVPNDSSRIKAALLEAIGGGNEQRGNQESERTEGGEHYLARLRSDKSGFSPCGSSAADKSDVVIITGGTGISHKDITIETVAPMLTKELPGFGEMFRALSFAEIGSGAMLSRAIAGTIGQKVVFCTPGSLNAVKLAAEKLIIPELSHLIWEATKHGDAGQEAKK
jgi:molybdenum cofactor biosynthesis protein B